MLRKKYRKIYMVSSVTIIKELYNGKTITYKLTFIDSFTFMSTSLSKFVNNLSAIYSKIFRCKNSKSECHFKGLKNNKLSYNSKRCRKKQSKPINGLIKKFPNPQKICNNDINKIILLSRKGVYPYEYMDSWDRFNGTTLPNKKFFTVNYT